MEIIISNTGNVPIYEQITEQIKNKILSGELRSGELLPSIRSLARDLRISVITTKNAYIALEKEGYVTTIPAKGTYVSDKNPEIRREEQIKRIEALLDEAIEIANISHISRDELLKIFDTLYETNY